MLRYAYHRISAAKTFPISNLCSRQKTKFLEKTEELVRNYLLIQLDRMGVLTWAGSFSCQEMGHRLERQ